MNELPPRLSNKEYAILELLINTGEMYGLEMVKISQGTLKRGTIYVTLGRMADKGYVESRQVKAEGQSGLPRRIFRATADGLRVFRALELARIEMAKVPV